MKSYDVIESDITLDRVQRDVQRFMAQERLDMGAGNIYGLDMRTYVEEATRRLVVQLQARVASKKYDVKTVRFPDGILQWIRFNLIASSLYGLKPVRWLVAHWPERNIEITMEANAYHPDVAIPDHDTFVEVVMKARRRGL